MNPYKFITGLSISYISSYKYKSESEVLLFNQFLPIEVTTNFNKDIDKDINFILNTLKSFDKKN